MRKKIGELLINAGVVTEAQVRAALGRRGAPGAQRLGEVLLAEGLCTPSDIARALAAQHGLPFVELPEEVPPAVTALVSVDFQSEHRILPFRMEVDGRIERIHIAVEDPSDMSLADELRFQLRKQVRVFIAASDDLDTALARVRGEPLDIVEAEPFYEDEDEAPPPPPVAADPSLEWDFPEAPSPAPQPVAEPVPARSPLRGSPPPPPVESPPPAPGLDVLDDLLGIAPSPPPRPPPPPEAEEAEEAEDTPRVPVVLFGGAAQGARPAMPLTPAPQFSDDDLAVLNDLERISQGEEASLDTEKVKPARMVASLIRLLIRKGLIQEREFLEELARK